MLILQSIFYSYNLLDRRSRKSYLRVLIVQSFLPVLDLIGIVILGLVTLNISGNSSANTMGSTATLFKRLSLYIPMDSKTGILLLLLIAIIVFTFKGILAITIIRRTFVILAESSYRFSVDLSKRFFSQTMNGIQLRSSFQTSDALNSACNFQITGVLGSASSFLGELTLLILVGAFMLFLNPLTTFAAILYFYFIFSYMQRKLLKISTSAGTERAESQSNNSRTIHEAIDSFRELYVGNLIGDMLVRYQKSRLISTNAHWRIFWVSIIPKYLFESALILGCGILATFQLATSDLQSIAFTLSSFLIAGTRILPSILRIQSAQNTISGSVGSSMYLRQLMADLDSKVDTMSELNVEKHINSELCPSITVNSLNYSYEADQKFTLDIEDLKVEAGERIAIVGPSGAGKSTLADLFLGVLQPKFGEVLIGGVSPRQVVRDFPGKISYVPQTVNLIDGTIFANVALFAETNPENLTSVWKSLEKAQLSEYVSSLPKDIFTEIGERGVKLSGGQKQRIALARALFTNPRLVILDEATSALDAQTEDLVRIAIDKFERSVTVVVIAHRLATIKDFSRIIYLDSGTILAQGTFNEVRRSIPQFEIQARLSGLV